MLHVTSSDSFAHSAWKVDQLRSSVEFSITQLFGHVTGSFAISEGNIKTISPDFTDAIIEFSMNVNSLDSGNKKRDRHLLSKSFFDAERFPTMRFKSSSISKAGILNYVLKGDLTIRNITRKVEFKVEHGSFSNYDWGNVKAGFKATGKIDRFEYGVKSETWMDIGGLVLDKWVTIILHVECTRQKNNLR